MFFLSAAWRCYAFSLILMGGSHSYLYRFAALAAAPPDAPLAPLCDGCPSYFARFPSAALALLLRVFSLFD